MTGRSRRTIESWIDLFITAGLAAAIGTVGSFAGDRAKAGREAQTKRCDAALSFLSDETPSPYIDDQLRRRLIADAAGAFERCMKGR